MQTVTSTGAIIPAAAQITEPGKIPQAHPGSAIENAGQTVKDMVEAQSGAIKTLGGKVGGRRHRRYKMKKTVRGGAGSIEVKNVPTLVSAGGVDAKGVYANLLKVQSQVNADAQFDSLGHSSPIPVPPLSAATGGKRRGRKTRKVHNGGRKHSTVRKSRRSSRRTRRVRSRRS